jgi:hypothetical protein
MTNEERKPSTPVEPTTGDKHGKDQGKKGQGDTQRQGQTSSDPTTPVQPGIPDPGEGQQGQGQNPIEVPGRPGHATTNPPVM